MISERERDWAAGFFDGEGTATVARHRRGCWKLSLKVDQARIEPLQRFAAAVGVGRVAGPYKSEGRTTMYRWQVQGEPAHKVAEILMYRLSEPKLEQMGEALLDLADYLRRCNKQCSPGLDETHYLINGGD